MWKLGERILNACATMTFRHPWAVIVASALLTVLALWYSSHMKIDTSAEGLLSNDLRFRQVEMKYRAVFPKNEALLVIIDAKTPADADSAAANLKVRLEALPDLFTSVASPGSESFFSDNGFLYLAPDRLKALLGDVEKSKPGFDVLATDPSLRGIADLAATPETANPELRARLLSGLGTAASERASDEYARTDWVTIFGIQRPEGRPGTRRFVLAKPVLDNASLNRAGPALDALKAEMQGVGEEEAEGVVFQVTGDPALRNQELSDAFSGASTASVLSFILVALSLVLGLRSGRLIAALLITLIVGGIWTTGLATLFVGSLNLISVAFMVLFIGLGIDFGTHTGLRFLEERKNGKDFELAMRQALVGEGPAIWLSAVCASVAFLSFVPTSYTGLAEFGIISALGMVVAVVITFTVQPALMALMPPKVPKWGDVHFGLGGWINRHYRMILVLSGMVTIGALIASAGARVDVNPLNLQNPKAPPVVAFHSLADDPQTSPYSLNVVAENPADVPRLKERLAAIPGVARVATAENYLPTEQDEKLKLIDATKSVLGPAFFDANARKAPPTAPELRASFERLRATAERLAADTTADEATRTAAAELRDGLAAFASKVGTSDDNLAVLQESLVGSLPQIISTLGERLQSARVLTVDDLPPNIRREWISDKGQIRLQVQPTEDIGTPEGLENFATKVQAIEPDASGVPASVTDAGTAILQAFGEAILYTTVAIGLIVWFLRRRLSDVALILLPLGIASVWTVAGSALLDLPFNFANVIVVPLLIGLGVAGSVHIVVRHRELEEEGGPNKDVLDTSTSLAVLVAQLNNVAAFATLAISAHRGLYSMGLLLGLAVLLTVIVCLVVLPAGLVALTKRKTARALKTAQA